MGGNSESGWCCQSSFQGYLEILVVLNIYDHPRRFNHENLHSDLKATQSQAMTFRLKGPGMYEQQLNEKVS